MTNPTGYLITSYGAMIVSEPRMSAYATALRESITHGCTVIDIGAGTGIFSLLACQYGAGAVIAIEPHDSVELLRAAAITNGFADRITIFKGLSTAYNDSKADVIISDLRGPLPLFEHHIPTIVDARNRLLADGGKLIPARDRLFAALAHDPEFYAPCLEPWIRNLYGLDLSDGHRFAVNQSLKANFTPIDLLSDAVKIALLDYSTIVDPNFTTTFDLVADGAGEAHGFVTWFDAELGPGAGFSNAPGEPEQVYGQTFFPFEHPLSLGIGDRIDIVLRANLIDGGYVWSWTSKLTRAGTAEVEREFRQSTFNSRILAADKLGRRSAAFVPSPSSDQAMDRHCLTLIDGTASLGEIADRLGAAYPGRFTTQVDALTHVADLAGRYRGNAAAVSPEEQSQ